jgi:hypothetical protein
MKQRTAHMNQQAETVRLARSVAQIASRLSHCDIAPTRFPRSEFDEYFTLDADWIIPALCRSIEVESPISNRALGHIVRELRALGFVVGAADLFAYPDSLVPDIKTGADVFDLTSLSERRERKPPLSLHRIHP